MSELTAKRCIPCEGGVEPLNREQAEKLLQELTGWELTTSACEICKTVEFENYYRTMAFVNAVAWMAHHENHHPDLEVSYNQCTVRYSTHAIEGLSENDFICAAKIDNLLNN